MTEQLPLVLESKLILKEPAFWLRNSGITIQPGNIANQKDTQNRKQELRARLYGYDMQIGLIGIVECYKHHCRSLYEMAEYLQVTEEYLKEALECYSRKYGENLVTIDNYAIRFVPSLQVTEFWK